MKRFKFLNESLNLVQKVYNTKTGKNPLLIYIDNKTSDNTFDIKDKLKQYGMEYLPSKLGKYAPHSWGWILWNGENDKQMPYIKKFIQDLPTFEGEERGFEDVTSGLDSVIQEMLSSLEAASMITPKTPEDAEAKKRVEDFKNMLQNELGNEKTQQFIETMIQYRNEVRKHNTYNYSWTNLLLIYLSTGGKGTVVRPLKQWQSMGYEPKADAAPITLIGKGQKHRSYTKQEKEIIINKYLEQKGVTSVDELPPSAKYDLYERKLKGRAIPGTEYQFCFQAYDVMGVQPTSQNAEKMPEEPDGDWWWDKVSRDEKDEKLTEALIAFAQSDECGNITINADNTQEGLGGARGNATNTGVINLVDDEYMRFPTAVHELTHQLRHWEFASQNNPSLKRFYNRWADREIREQEAELCASFVISNYGYNMQPHLNYVYEWGLGKSNCAKIFDQIAEVASFIEKGIQKYLK